MFPWLLKGCSVDSLIRGCTLVEVEDGRCFLVSQHLVAHHGGPWHRERDALRHSTHVPARQGESFLIYTCISVSDRVLRMTRNLGS